AHGIQAQLKGNRASGAKGHEPFTEAGQLIDRMAREFAEPPFDSKPNQTLQPEHPMNLSKIALVIALGLSSALALAGEIKDTTVYGYNADNQANGSFSYAAQGIGVATGNATIQNSFIDGGNARNRADGYGSYASQEIGAAAYGGMLNNVYVNGNGARNTASGTYSVATQEIGKAVGFGSLIQNSVIYAPNATNSS